MSAPCVSLQRPAPLMTAAASVSEDPRVVGRRQVRPTVTGQGASFRLVFLQNKTAINDPVSEVGMKRKN